MLASLDWLRSLCPVKADADRVAEALTSRGLTVDSLNPHGDDHALEIDVPANRPDCLGHAGLAREISAAFGVPVAPAAEAPAGQDPSVSEAVRVEIEDPRLCPRYTARIVRGVRIEPSPGWIVRRLEVCGLRPLNNVVDISNIVLLETGHPVHFFDLDCLAQATIRIRRPRAGETLYTLDGVERKLTPEMLVIADARRAVALAGVMGGADSEIGPSTRDVLIEAAAFDPATVRATSRGLGLMTDASHRFERGVDAEGAVGAQALAARLLVQIAHGQAASGMIDAYPLPLEARKSTLRLGELQRLLGYQPETEEARAALAALGLSPALKDDERFEVRVPSWRVDLEREADLVEEVARHLGYDRIPLGTDGLPTGLSGEGDPGLEQRARESLSHRGFHEAYGYAMIAREEDTPFVEPSLASSLALTNPIAESLAVLRRSILPGLLKSVDLNLRRGVRDVRLFEVGHVFHSRGAGEFPSEPLHAGIAWSGAGRPRDWLTDDREVDLFDVMGAVEGLLRTLRPGHDWTRIRASRPGLHPGQSAEWHAGANGPIAWAGALHPDLQAGMPQTVFMGEIDLTALGRLDVHRPRYRSLPRLSPVTRDLAVVLTADRRFADVMACLQAVPSPAPAEIRAVDHYAGPPLADDEQSLTLRVRIQPQRETLTDVEIEDYRQRLVDALAEGLGVRIRA